MCFVVTCWERADLLALVCGVFCEFVTFPLVSWVRCGTWLYRFLIFATLLTLFKLFNNAIFGKTLANDRKRQRVELVSTNQQRKTKKLIASPAFKSFTIINENLASIHMEKTTVTLNRPVYAGVSTLDISKWHMYSFHYDVVKSVYGEKADVCFSDTDSLCYFIETDDLYGDLKSDRFPNCFDFSDYPETHPLYSAGNKKCTQWFTETMKRKPLKVLRKM